MSLPLDRPIHILVFGRLPIAGRAKTRLVPALGLKGAADLYALLLERALTMACAARADNIAKVTLWLDVESRPEEIESLVARHGIDTAVQAPGDLGLRMHDALCRTLAAGALPLLMGSDVPVLTTAALQQAANLLWGGSDVVLAPALDGGYGLIGVTRPLPVLFEDMPWSTAAVLAETRRRCAQDGLDLAELDWVWDVDGPADLSRLDEVPELADWRRRIGIDAAV